MKTVFWSWAAINRIPRAELAAEVGRQTGKVVKYNNLFEADTQKILSKYLEEMAHLYYSLVAHSTM